MTDGEPHAVNRSDKRPMDAALKLALVVIALGSLFMVLWNLQDASLKNANTGSRYATVESLVDYGTYAIDRSIYRGTIDRVKIGDKFYSSKPPMLPTYVAGVYWVYKAITGHRIADYEGEVVWLGSLVSGWLSHFLFLLYLWKLGRLLFSRHLAIVGMFGAGAFAYLGAGYATTLNNHSVAAAMAVAGLYHALAARVPGGRTRDWIYAGLWLGGLPTIALPFASLSLGLGICLLLRSWQKTLRWFLPAALPPLVLHLALTYAITGGIVPAYLRREFYNYEGSYWLREGGIDALREAKHVYAFHVLLGHHGLFSMTPLYAFSVYGLWHAVRRAKDRAVSIAVAASTAAVIVFLIFYSHNYGGWCVGMRWLVPSMALLTVYLGYFLEVVRPTRSLWVVLLLCFGVSAYNTQDALSGPFQFSRWHNFIEGKPNRARTGDKKNLGRAYQRSKRKKPRRSR